MDCTEAEFERVTGRKPVHDDLERVNCKQVGEAGHHACGMCPKHGKPRFECGCLKFNDKEDFAKLKRRRPDLF